MSTVDTAVITRSQPDSPDPELPPSPALSHDHLEDTRKRGLSTMSTRCLSPGSSLSRCDTGTTDTHEHACNPRGSGEEEDEEPLQGTRALESRWHRALAECKLQLTLENSGSVARDHLASERTFLAYTRTSLTIASAGIALVQLFTLSAAATDQVLEPFARPLGAALIVLGLCTLGMGVARYFLVQNALIRGVYPVARISTSLLSFVLLALLLAIFVIVLAAR